MSILNIEIKAHCADPDKIRNLLKKQKAFFKGIDHQKDTYFQVENGRLKLREGNIENCLIFYERSDQKAPKPSDVILYNSADFASLKELLIRSLGVKVIVEKKREIYFIENVKFHIDSVKDLGSFVEIEAIDKTGDIGKEQLNAQCSHYLQLFEISVNELIDKSYSDLLLEQKIVIKAGTIDQIVDLSRQIPEFIDPYQKDEYEQRLRFIKHQILLAYVNGGEAGFAVGYQVDDKFYNWMEGVLPDYRQMGISKIIAKKQEDFCRRNYLRSIYLKTRSKHKIMLFSALKNGYKIIDIISKEDKNETRIILEKKI